MFGRHAFIVSLGVIAAGAAAAAAWAQGGAGSYPDHPIRVIVSVPAGGGVDTVTRLVTAKMQTFLGQPMVVENRAGVGGSIAADYVFHSPPDGYTLLASQPSPITTNPLLYKSLNYDPTQFVPIAIMSHVPNVVLVRKDFPAKTVQELIAYAKANPGKINFASQGIGTTSHTTAELFQKITGTKMTHVPYKGTAPAVNDLLAGNVDLMFNELASSIELYKSGRARILAVTVNHPRRGAAGYSDAGRSRRDGLRFRHLACADRAAENARRYRRQAQRGGQQGDDRSRPAGAIYPAQYQPRRRNAGRGRRLHQIRNAALGRRDPRCRHQAGMT